MRVKLPECHLFTRQAKAGSEANIHEASFIERRLFYLTDKLCYKGTQCD